MSRHDVHSMGADHGSRKERRYVSQLICAKPRSADYPRRRSDRSSLMGSGANTASYMQTENLDTRTHIQKQQLTIHGQSWERKKGTRESGGWGGEENLCA